MAPNSVQATGVLYETDDDPVVTDNTFTKYQKTAKSVYSWPVLTTYIYFHIVAVYGIYLMITSAKTLTTLSAAVFYFLSILGGAAGSHRLWAHRSFEAKFPLRLFLIITQSIAFQGPALSWARDHRVHHKYNETDADPYNPKRGFFFSHIGWMFHRKHPQVIAKAKGMDFSDLYADPLLRFQKKYFLQCIFTMCFLVPTAVPMYFWDETFINAFCVNMFRYLLSLNCALAVNSVAHRWGSKPYDKALNPSENLTLSLLTLGESWHNYHHVFPWDYKTAELGKYSTNVTTGFIDLMAKIGWAYNLKSASEDMIRKRVLRTGDGSHEIWGWGDKDQPNEDLKDAVIDHKKNA